AKWDYVPAAVSSGCSATAPIRAAPRAGREWSTSAPTISGPITNVPRAALSNEAEPGLPRGKEEEEKRTQLVRLEANGCGRVEYLWRCPMIQTVEAVVDDAGRVRLLGEVHVSGPRRALVTVLEEPAAVPAEAALAVDWLRPEEDAAWSHLQPGK